MNPVHGDAVAAAVDDDDDDGEEDDVNILHLPTK